ncbi:MAG: bifunctional D-glycero-beta-D-manno-heptose-7-phosphate kinase/D-glycero-beta-D-manno-heptose 1-phosphate adenylyltransferase HldE [Pseudomonadota bacterium]
MPNQFLPTKTVLIIGDVMLDRYCTGSTERISPEAPVPVVHVRSSDDKPGGAANVAMNLAALGMHTRLLGAVGNDDAGDSLVNQLQRANIDTALVRCTTQPTITKTRVLSRNQQLLRLDTEERIDNSVANELMSAARTQLVDADVLLISDYNKGTLEGVLPDLIADAKAAGIPVLVDPKGHNFSRYHGASVLTPNRAEFFAAAGHCESETEYARAAAGLIDQHAFDALLLTRSEEGMSLYPRDGEAFHLPAQVREVFDVTGAGDTVIATLAACIAAGYTLEQAAELANTAAGIVVGKLGAASVSAGELEQAVQRETGSAHSGNVTDLETLRPIVERLQSQGKKLVFTNGCFDILHAGHVRYLQEARTLGDYLIVAINSDTSVKRLKGAGRPVNDEGARMQVLAALQCVDYVLPFAEDTPASVIDTLVPDVLVKGGDWAVADIIGSDTVLANGGEVKSLAYADGYSTTSIIKSIQDRTGKS